jgi:hypothetical protein
MSDQFERHVAKQFPNISNGGAAGPAIGKPWDVVIGVEPGNGTMPDDPVEAMRHALGKLHNSFTVRQAVENDLRAARLTLMEVNSIKRNLERTVEELTRVQSLLSEVLE